VLHRLSGIAKREVVARGYFVDGTGWTKLQARWRRREVWCAAAAPRVGALGRTETASPTSFLVDIESGSD
jgi:hypothetical protein